MKSAINEIYSGVFSSHNPDLGQEYSKANDKAEEEERALLELIKNDPEAIKAFEAYKDASDDIMCEEVRGYYKQGFRDGFRSALDAINED